MVRSKGSRAWVLRYQMGGRHRDMGLGPYPEVALADPREKALDARRLLKRDGKASPTPRLWKRQSVKRRPRPPSGLRAG